MAVIEGGTFEDLVPSRFISFSIPNPGRCHPYNPYGNILRVAVLDSPLPNSVVPGLAALLVPKHRECDWIFSTEHGHFQLLFSLPAVSRLILLGDLPRESGSSGLGWVFSRRKWEDEASYQEILRPLLLAVAPKAAFRDGIPDIAFISYEDNVIRCMSVEYCFGPVVGDMLVEDVEIEMGSTERLEVRRRLRFKRMPNLAQTEIRVSPAAETGHCRLGGFVPEIGFLVQPYLAAMVASLSLVGPMLEGHLRSGARTPRILCVGVGGGALLMFLRTWFEFDILGVEADEAVLDVAKRYFGLTENHLLQVRIGDGIELLKRFARQGVCWSSDNSDMPKFRSAEVGLYLLGVGNVKHKDDSNETDINTGTDGKMPHVDVIMVDLDSSDASHGLSAPPLEFVDISVIESAKLALHRDGILVVNVIPPDSSFFERIVTEFKKVFSELYEIDVGNSENFVLIASATPVNFVAHDGRNHISKKLREVIGSKYLDGIKKI